MLRERLAPYTPEKAVCTMCGVSAEDDPHAW
jgi:hypothetical protein